MGLWGASVTVLLAGAGQQHTQVLGQTYADEATAKTAAIAAALVLKNQMATALGNLLPQLFVTVDLTNGQVPVWIRATQVASIVGNTYQY